MDITITKMAEVKIISYFSVMYFTVKLVAKDLNVLAGRKTQTTKVDKNFVLEGCIFPVLHRVYPIIAKIKRIATCLKITNTNCHLLNSTFSIILE